MEKKCEECKNEDTELCGNCSNLWDNISCSCHINSPCSFHENLKYEDDDRYSLIKKQKELYVRINAPFFAPNNGFCWKCGNDMVNKLWAKEHITGCQHCHKSYCE